MEPDPQMPAQAILAIFNSFSYDIAISIAIFIILIILSALISGSEVAYFSISHGDQEQLNNEGTPAANRVLNLLKAPKRLLATILVANNFVNVAIVAISSFILRNWMNSSAISSTNLFIIQVVVVTFIILLLGEVMPKVYATRHNLMLAKLMSRPLTFTKVLVKPISYFLISSSLLIDKKIKKKTDSISIGDLGHALDIAKDVTETSEEKKILEGIVKFGHTDAKQIMTPRLDVVAIENTMSYGDLKKMIVEAKYSRIPIYKNTFDTIEGVLYIKDLLPYIDQENVEWNTLLRKAKFIPENKKLDDLLSEFQQDKMHLAVVVDEYGGTSGIITLEDVLEEIVGDITDEFDDEDLVFSQIDENNFVFQGKTPLIDLYRVLGIEGKEFEKEKGESDTVAGFCIEQAGKILRKNEKVSFLNYTFTVESADRRKIKQVKLTRKIEKNVDPL